MTVYIDSSLLRRSKVAAVELDRDLSTLVAEALTRELERQKK